MGKQWKQWRILFSWAPKSANSGCSYEIKRCLLLGRKAMISLDSVLRNRDIILPTEVHIVKAMVFPVVIYRCESWTIKKAEHWIDSFELWCWRRFLRVLWFASKEVKPVKPKINQPWIIVARTDAEAPMLWPPDQRVDSLEKTLRLGKIEQRRRGQQRMRWFGGIINSMMPPNHWASSGSSWRTGKFCVL